MQKSIIAIIGTTGVGKTDLGIQLAKTLQGEIINGDSMQVYKGPDIITNKIPLNEREEIPHHLMDFLDPHKEYRVTDFTKDALRTIKEIHNRQRIPIIVGGTNYYIQSLLWRDSLIEGDSFNANDKESNIDEEILDAKPEVVYKRLQEVDPVMASKWHQNDTRRVRRSLQIYMETGKPHSQWIKEQNDPKEKASSLRFSRTCIFWLYSDLEVLDHRLNSRIDKMIKSGLFEEINYLRNSVKTGKIQTPLGNKEDFTRGIWQAIGYKEFDPYLTAVEESNDASYLDALKTQGIESMKAATHRYARTQIRWIRNKLLYKCQQESLNNRNEEHSGNIRIYLLDATSLETWNQEVRDKSIAIAKEFLENGIGPNPTSVNLRAKELLKSKKDM
ncbi:8288_t:CDS:10, partial [Funneliformis caledonium]